MDSQDDVLIIGAGMAGLSAAAELHEAGLRVRMVEARDRIGGRTWSIGAPGIDQPIELGAEFIHGRPPELFSIAKQAQLDPVELGGKNFGSDGKTVKPLDFFEASESVLDQLNDRGPDRSFLQFARETAGDKNPQDLKWAMRYVRGFHAADPAQISVHAMVRETEAEEKIDGDRQFRPRQGYRKLVEWYEQRLKGVAIVLNAEVRRIRWSDGGVEAETSSDVFSAKKAIITLPLGVLQAERVQFAPDIPEKREAMGRLAMGKILRVTLQFRERFWAKRKSGMPDLEQLHFLMTEDEFFPTWWTTTPPSVTSDDGDHGHDFPSKAPLLIGWSPDVYADRMKGMSDEESVGQARASLERALPQYASEIADLFVAGYVHDWQSDPYSLGAYSYVKVNGLGAQEALGAPVAGTLFFAGEATESQGHHATVHGAIATGLRAAEEVKRVLGDTVR